MQEPIEFPIITIGKFSFDVIQHVNELTRTTSAGLKNGLYNYLEVIDCNGRVFVATKASKVEGIGAFWGYNIFLNQNICIALDFDTTIGHISLSDLKVRIIDIINRDRHFWDSSGNRKEVINLVQRSERCDALIEELRKVMYNEHEID